MRLTIGDEVLNTNTMTVTTKDDPTKELIPSILLTNARVMINRQEEAPISPKNLKITIKNDNDVLKSSNYTEDGFYCQNKDLTPNTQILFQYDDNERMRAEYTVSYWTIRKNPKVFFDSESNENRKCVLLFDKKYDMPVVLQLYYDLDTPLYAERSESIIEVQIKRELFNHINDPSIPEPLLEELRDENKKITFLFSSVRPDFQKRGTSLEKVYEVKSMEKNPCNFYHEFLALANFRLPSIQKKRLPIISTSQKSHLTKFYILFELRHTYMYIDRRSM